MRRIQAIVVGIFCMAVVAGMRSPEVFSGELTDAEFQRLHEELQPEADAPWRSIPWKIALLDAQRTAVEEDKPIFIWAMDGHPLGCT